MYPHERDVLPKIGPHFLLGSDGAVQFKFVVDTNNVLGPRMASAADKATHPEAWAQFERENSPAAEPQAAQVTWDDGSIVYERYAGYTKLNITAEDGAPVEQPKRRGRPPKVA